MTGTPRIDLNADVGESFGSWRMGADEELLPLVSSANVACGFHAGDPSVMRRTLAQCASLGVVVGAHVSYRDLAGFGRRFVDLAPAELEADVQYQLAALRGLAAVEGATVGYVKPHGALLYNAIAHHEAQAAAVVAAVHGVDPSLALLGLPGSRVLALAQDAGLTCVTEAFADRGYRDDGTLVPRSEPGAVLHDPGLVADRVVSMVRDGEVLAVTGERLRIGARSVCLHGDTPGAVAMARAVRAALDAAGVRVAPFVGESSVDSGPRD